MRFDEGSPIEFIFGKLPRSLEPKFSQIKQPNSPFRIEFELWWTGFIYGTLALIYSYLVINIFELTPNLTTLLLIGSYIILTTLVSSFKFYLGFKRYGPDIQEHEHFSFQFLIVQSFLTYTFSAMALIGAYFLINALDFIHPIALGLILGITLYLMYSKVISTLPLSSVGLGIGLIPTIQGLVPFWRNFNTLNDIKGKREYHLSSLRLILWLVLVSLETLNGTLGSSLLVVLVYASISFSLEKHNASSLMMKLRAKIQKMSPTILPNVEFDPSNSFVLRDPVKSMNFKKRSRSFTSRVSPDYIDKNPMKSPTKEDLTPIAMRSMNRIASSIMQED